MQQRTAIHWALGLYLVAQVLPAFRLGGDLVPGWEATWMSLVGTFIACTSPGDGLIEGGFDLASPAGGLANILIVVALVAAYCRTRRLAPALSVIAFAGAVVSVGALYSGRKSFNPHCGCILWLSAMGWLAFRTTFPCDRIPGIAEQAEQQR